MGRPLFYGKGRLFLYKSGLVLRDIGPMLLNIGLMLLNIGLMLRDIALMSCDMGLMSLNMALMSRKKPSLRSKNVLCYRGWYTSVKNGFEALSVPTVVSGPWPQQTVKSSSRLSTLLRIDPINCS